MGVCEVKDLLCKYVDICYTNWKGETRIRTIHPISIWFGSTEWHKEPQWLLKAIDLDGGKEKDFAMKDIHYWGAN